MDRPLRSAVTADAAARITEKYVLPPTLVTPHRWSDTVAKSRETSRKGVWVRNELGLYAHRKPGVLAPGSVESLREITCTVLGGWIGVPMPRMELLQHADHGACLLSYDLPDGQTYRWYNVMEMKLAQALYADGLAQLQGYAGPVTVLDVLVGACDRRNSGNHLFVERERRWYAIDYGFSFNRHPPNQLDGVGDATIGYGLVPRQETWPEVIAAIKHNRDLLDQALRTVEQIPDDRIEALLALPPASFGSDGVRGGMVDFLKYRRSRIRDLMRDWCNRVGLNGVVT